ncbi:MAG: dihydroneopterin aldolase [Candidatus Poseidoniales archaeon]|jgi:dihydroneopterin aldolase
MTIRVALEAYTIMAKHGYYPHEHEHDQPFILSVWATLRNPQIEEKLDQTLNYADIQIAIDKVMLQSNKPILLMETMAQKIVDELCQNPHVQTLHVRIEKPEAPLPHPGGLAVVELEWARN